MKLYKDTETIDTVLTSTSMEEIDMDDENIYVEDLDDLEADIEAVNENIESTAINMEMIDAMRSHINSKEKGSREYLVTVESYKVVTDNICRNLGMSKMMPSLESFSIKQGLEASHEIAMEGLWEVIKKFWAHVKDLFKRFFDKVGQFFRVLVKADLKLDEYDKALDKLMAKLGNNRSMTYKGPATFGSKLPKLLGPEGIETMTMYDFMSQGRYKLDALDSVVTYITNNSKDMSKEIDEVIKLIDEVSKSTDAEKTAAGVENIKALCSKIPGYILGEDNSKRSINLDVDSQGKINAKLSSIDPKYALRALVSGASEPTSLPERYNMFYALDTERNMAIVIRSQDDNYANNTIEALDQVDLVLDLFQVYKGIKTKDPLKKLEAFSKESKKQTDKLLKTVDDKLVPAILKSRGKEDILNSIEETTVTVKGVVHYAVKVKGVIYTEEAIEGVSESISDLSSSIKGLGVQEAARIVKVAREVLNRTYNPEEDGVNNSKLLTDVESFLRGYVRAHNDLVTSIFRDLPRLQMECRKELAKYIYNCAKHFR